MESIKSLIKFIILIVLFYCCNNKKQSINHINNEPYYIDTFFVFKKMDGLHQGIVLGIDIKVNDSILNNFLRNPYLFEPKIHLSGGFFDMISDSFKAHKLGTFPPCFIYNKRKQVFESGQFSFLFTKSSQSYLDSIAKETFTNMKIEIIDTTRNLKWIIVKKHNKI